MARRRGVRATFAAALVTIVMASGCWVWGTTTNAVIVGNGVYFYFFKYATDDVVDGLLYGFYGDIADTMEFMDAMAWTKLLEGKWERAGYTLGDFDHFFDTTQSQMADFGSAAQSVYKRPRCLVMHRNLNPFGDRHNWTWREHDDRYCKWGQHYELA